MSVRCRSEKRWRWLKIIEGGQGRLSPPISLPSLQSKRRQRLPDRCLDTSQHSPSPFSFLSCIHSLVYTFTRDICVTLPSKCSWRHLDTPPHSPVTCQEEPTECIVANLFDLPFACSLLFFLCCTTRCWEPIGCPETSSVPRMSFCVYQSLNTSCFSKSEMAK